MYRVNSIPNKFLFLCLKKLKQKIKAIDGLEGRSIAGVIVKL